LESPEEAISTDLNEHDSAQRQLSELFGSYRAEWLREQIFDLYTSPIYFPELTTNRSCVLIGGRGTGKTTVLRALSWEGQHRLSDQHPSEWPYFGVYYRADTNRVAAFRGPEVSTQRWNALFAHYFNLIITERLLALALWYQGEYDNVSVLSSNSCGDIATALALEGKPESVHELSAQIRTSRLGFETYINSVADQPSPRISMQGAPLALVVDELAAHPTFSDKPFFVIVDEYENLLDEQQRVVNTLLKHSSSHLSYKIGVKELGFRQRTTLNEHEQLRSPADYVRIVIEDKLGGVFPQFAANVCDERISRLKGPGAEFALKSVRALFVPLTEDAEARLLGVEDQVDSIRAQLKSADPDIDLQAFDSLPLLYQYLIGFWSKGHGSRLSETYNDYVLNKPRWDTRYVNYKHALLYTLRRKRRGIRKYYAGWDTFAHLSGNNIRFYLQLVEQSLLLHLDAGRNLATPLEPDLQTRAAQLVGRTNLSELEGLSVYGMYLSRLVLGLGRIFEILAQQLEGRSPEVNQFYLVDDGKILRTSQQASEEIKAETLIAEAVTHLALARFPGTKPTTEGDTEDYDYMLHPIFAPLFGFSYRRKRKLALTQSQLLSLIQSPRPTIREILGNAKRRPVDFEEELPDQLALFEAFYRSDG
jgi:hypothetical protein